MLKKVLAVFPVFIFFAFSGLFVFASPSSPVVFEAQPQDLTTAEKQDYTWQWIKSELRNRYTYLDFGPDWKPLFTAAKDDTQYAKEGSELEEEVKNWLLTIFAAAKRKDKTGVLEFLLEKRTPFLRQQKFKWDSLVDAIVGEHHIYALLNPKYAYLAKTPISIKKEGKEYKGILEPLFIAAKRFGSVKTIEEFAKINIPGFREIIWDFRFLSSVGESDINAAFAATDAKNKPKLDNLWSGIKDKLKKPEYVHLSKTSITIKEKEYDLELLFVAAKDDAQYRKEGSELPASEKDKLQELVNAKVVFSDLLDSLKLLNSKRLTVFQKLWTNQPSSFHYLLWLPLFNIQNLTVNQMDLTVGQLGSEVAGMLADQKLDFINLSEKGKQELLSLLNEVGSLSEVVKTAVWKQVQNSEKWKKITDANSIDTIMRIKKLLAEEVVELNIKKVDHPFFPQGYDLSFLQDVVTWKDAPLKQLLSGISIRIENNNVIFTSHLFPDQPVLKLPFNKIISVFDQLTLESIETELQTKVATKLDDYKSSIQINLKNFLQNDIFQIQFNKQNYSIENLIAENNLAKSGSELEGSARKELIYLFSGDLNSSILEDILEVRDSVQKKETDQSLLIVLTVVGTILGVSGIGVFFYFFTRR